ncbi:MAG: carbon-nitrogen hydrolase family protein [archaeon]
MVKQFKVGLVQFSPRMGLKEHNIEIMKKYIEKARLEDARLIIFPELSTSGYICRDTFYKLAEPLEGPSVREIERSALENNVSVIFGMPRQGAEEGVLHNSALIVGPKGLLGFYDKIHLPTHTIFEEKRYFRPGYETRVIDTEVGRIGLTICYDLFFPEITRLLVADGAQFIACISVSPDGRREYFETFTTARAMENSVYLAYVNRVGIEDGVQYWGGSRLMSPNGVRLTELSYYDEKLIVGEVDYGDLPKIRAFLPTLRDLRPDLIKLLYDKAKGL